MAYVRKKKFGAVEYNYLVEGTWVDGKVKQKVLCYLGTADNVKDAIQSTEKETRWLKKSRKEAEEDLLKMKEARKKGASYSPTRFARLAFTRVQKEGPRLLSQEIKGIDRKIRKLQARIRNLKKHL